MLEHVPSRILARSDRISTVDGFRKLETYTRTEPILWGPAMRRASQISSPRRKARAQVRGSIRLDEVMVIAEKVLSTASTP